jgi:hypothetical protein
MVIEFKGTDSPSLTGRSVALVVRTARTTDSLSLTGHSIQKIHSLFGIKNNGSQLPVVFASLQPPANGCDPFWIDQTNKFTACPGRTGE